MADYKVNSKERLEYIAVAAKKILQYCNGKDEATFLSDEMLQSAVLYQFLIIGEAIQHVDPELLRKYPYPWHLPKSFRNYIAHEYFGINLHQIYKTITDLLPDFTEMVNEIIEQL